MHIIRLREPWSKFTTESGRCCYLRRFGAPGHLDPDEVVHLVCDPLSGLATVTLNGQLLGVFESAQLCVDITSQLQPRNEVIIELPIDCQLGSVSLQIGIPI